MSPGHRPDHLRGYQNHQGLGQEAAWRRDSKAGAQLFQEEAGVAWVCGGCIMKSIRGVVLCPLPCVRTLCALGGQCGQGRG